MKIEVNKESLLRNITIADSVIPSKTVNPILSNCLFNITRDEIEIISTDNEIAVRTKLEAVSEDNFSFTVNGKRLSQILKELPKGEVLLDIDESYMLNIFSKSKDIKGSYKIIGTSREDYPQIPDFNEDNCIEIDQALFKEMIRKVIFAAANDAIKPVFNGIHFIYEGENLTAVSSDSRRLSMISKKVNKSINLEKGVIIPLKTINEVYKILNVGLCRFSVNNNMCFFRIGETEIISRLIDGNFPNYKQVIPKDYSFSVIANTKKMTEVLRRVSVFTKEPSFKVLLNFKNGTLNIEAKTAELGEASEDIDVEFDKDSELLIGINSQYLLDAIKEIDAHSIKIGLTGQMSPVTVMPENDDKYISVVMPIQIKN